MDPIAEAIERLRHAKTAEERADAASWLGRQGDVRALEALEHAILCDDGTWYEEGGFADRINSVADVSLGALEMLVSRVTPSAGDRARWRDRFAKSGGSGHAFDLLFRALGAAALAVVEEAARDADPAVRARAITIRDGLPVAIAHEDEAVRLATMKRNPEGTSLYREAMRRFPREPSANVKRAIFEVWKREGTQPWIRSYEAMMFLACDDVDIRRKMAELVLESKIHPTNDGPPLKDLAREILGVVEAKPVETKPAAATEPANRWTALLLQRRVENAKALADAIAEAERTGKERFDWDGFLQSGCRPHGEEEQRFDYYVMKSEIRTMAEYIAHRKAMEPWEDSR